MPRVDFLFQKKVNQFIVLYFVDSCPLCFLKLVGQTEIVCVIFVVLLSELLGRVGYEILFLNLFSLTGNLEKKVCQNLKFFFIANLSTNYKLNSEQNILETLLNLKSFFNLAQTLIKPSKHRLNINSLYLYRQDRPMVKCLQIKCWGRHLRLHGARHSLALTKFSLTCKPCAHGRLAPKLFGTAYLHFGKKTKRQNSRAFLASTFVFHFFNKLFFIAVLIAFWTRVVNFLDCFTNALRWM